VQGQIFEIYHSLSMCEFRQKAGMSARAQKSQVESTRQLEKEEIVKVHRIKKGIIFEKT
jgi:hypothetical protein